MMYVYGGAAIVILFLAGRLVKNWNAPKVAEAEAKKKEAAVNAKNERLRIRAEKRKEKHQK